MTKKVFKAAFIATLPVLAGYLAMGCAFGILLDAQAGLGAFWSLLMSVTIYSGSMQFAAVDILNAGLPLLKVALLTIFINIRYAMYGFALIERFEGKGWKKLYMITALTDETYALQVENKVPEGEDSTAYCLAIAMLDHCYWITGCLVGSIAGHWMTFNKKGIDFAMTALFTVIFLEQWLSSKNHVPALIGLGISAVCLAVLGPDRFVIPSMVLFTLTLAALRRRLEVAEDVR